jgi:hypothetical protein
MLSIPLRPFIVLLFLAANSGFIQAQTQLTVNFASNQGAVLHGASGWLYGQAESALPTQNLMAPLKPQFSAQKPPRGLQHAGGDATQVINDFLSAGGKQMEVYLQDIYETFYPPYPGINSYKATITPLVQQLAANSNHAKFAYVPFNEPDGQWYGSYNGITNLSQFESDWKTIYQTIRSIDSAAVIVGPNFFAYDPNAYQSFLSFAKANNVVPNQISWHELQSNFFTGWFGRYSSYRGIESSVGISPLPIVINEYAEGTGDLGVPGRLIQFISRFETSKVYGCIAFWSPAGSLSNLGAMGVNNQATGAWWLYQWYGSLTGNSYAVSPPNPNAVGLAGVASADPTNKEARVIFGGTSGGVNVVLQNLNSLSYLGNPVHVTVWGVDSTGTSNPSNGPYYVQEANYTATNNQITVTVPNTNASSAYFAIVTPAKSRSNVNTAGRYEAEYADLFGTAAVQFGNATGYSGTYFVQGYGSSNNAVTEFDVNAPSSGYYNVDLRYSSPNGAKVLQLYLNGPALETINLPGTANGNTWSDATTTIFLTQGINRIAYGALSNSGSSGVQLDYINLSTGAGTIDTYEAAASNNTLGGTAVRENDNNAPGGTDVGFVGQGAANYVQFNDISVPFAGLYRMLISFKNDETYTGNEAGPVFRFSQNSLNGGPASTVYFSNTFSWSTYVTEEVDVQLNAGSNTIRFFNSTTSPNPNIDSGWAPVFARIQIAAAVE